MINIYNNTWTICRPVVRIELFPLFPIDLMLVGLLALAALGGGRHLNASHSEDSVAETTLCKKNSDGKPIDVTTL